MNVEEGIDSGDIVVQKKFPVTKKDTFNSIVKKNYDLAPKAILEAINILEKEDYKLIENDDSKATYNTVPALKETLEYRVKRIRQKS